MSQDRPTVEDAVHSKTLKRALSFVSQESRHWVLDALACTFHNEGYGLQGNTEKSDVRWLAHMIRSAETFGNNDFERIPKEDQERYLKLAEISIKALPALIERIASRYIGWAAALRSMEEMERAKKALQKGGSK
jgi:hypothetical protein